MSTGTKLHTAIQFLERMTPPDGFGTVVAIDPITSKIAGRAYTRDTAISVADFIAEYAAQRWNLYWSVNPTDKRINKKTKKDDIARVVYLHVDIDDPSPKTLAALQSYRVLPSEIIFSGHGYWGFWRLREAIRINGNVAELEAYNAQIERELGGDICCHNLDRIARLPGTTNWPTKTKREKGLTEPVEAYIKESHPERTYALADFGEPSDQQRDRAPHSLEWRCTYTPASAAAAARSERKAHVQGHR
jgi:hypothetical protein